MTNKAATPASDHFRTTSKNTLASPERSGSGARNAFQWPVVGRSHQPETIINFRTFTREWRAVLRENLRPSKTGNAQLRQVQAGAAPTGGLSLRAHAALRSPKAGCAGHRMGFIKLAAPVVRMSGISRGSPAMWRFLLTCAAGCGADRLTSNWLLVLDKGRSQGILNLQAAAHRR